jgi:hypothetical protein
MSSSSSSKEKPGLTREQLGAIRHRRQLISILGWEVQGGTSETRLYASLLAHAILRADPELIKEFGDDVANKTGMIAQFGS